MDTELAVRAACRQHADEHTFMWTWISIWFTFFAFARFCLSMRAT